MGNLSETDQTKEQKTALEFLSMLHTEKKYISYNKHHVQHLVCSQI